MQLYECLHLKMLKGKEAKPLPPQDPRLDKGALNGLRGLFAFHVMTFHACLFADGGVHPTVNLLAQVDMPLFFLLSGFSLTLAYGKTLWNGSTRGCFGLKTSTQDGVDTENPDGDPKIFDSWAFYKKRLIRILPLNYLGHVLVLIVWKFGYSNLYFFKSIINYILLMDYMDKIIHRKCHSF